MIRALDAFGSIPGGVDIPTMAAELQELYAPFVEEGVVVAQLGELMDTMIRSMVRYRVRIPRELVLLSKQMLYLEGAARALAPDVDLLGEQTLIYQTLFTKYPDLALKIALAVQRGQEMDAALASERSRPRSR
jgi:predicted unusual protein kinase regulating ubiquinone biosynthesis (AarF/ABC1/UbiB family)